MKKIVVLVTAGLLSCFSVQADDQPDVSIIAIIQTGQSGTSLQSPRGLAFGSKANELLVANSGKSRIEIFSLSGRARGCLFLNLWDKQTERYLPGLPIAVAVDAIGRTLVVDNTTNSVEVLDWHGRSVTHFELPIYPSDSIEVLGPAALTVSPDNNILVATRGLAGRVYRFDQDFNLLGSWGQIGTATGQLSGISGLATLADGKIVVVCTQTQLSVQVFTPDGQFIYGFGQHDVGPGNFSFPTGVTVTPDQRIWVVDEIRQVVQVFDQTGKFLKILGSFGDGPGKFNYPCGIASNNQGYLAVSERVGGRVQLFRIKLN